MQVSTDSRNDWERLRRVDLWHLADAWEIQYPPGATKTDMISILTANSVNPNDPRGAFEWDIVHSQDESGHPVVSRYPRRKAHATANKDIDYAGIMDKKAQDEMESENQTLKNEVAEMKKMMAKLLESKSTGLAITEDVDLTVEATLTTTVENYSGMKFQELRKLAKSKGLVIQNTDKKIEVIAKLEELDGEITP